MTNPAPLHWLFLDLNSYFASVEQQIHPELRGKPVAVVPMMADTTVCIAASYEAKAFGVKTGSHVSEARALCPGLRFVEAKHGPYVEYHHRIVKAVESVIPVDHTLSIDEMICRLLGSQREVAAARALAIQAKHAIAEQVGPYLKSSVGLAPNKYLAKLASDMQKPDGLTVLLKEDLPEALYRLKLRDFCGIGRKMESHFRESGITTVKQLCGVSLEQMRDIWGGVVGERFWHWLRGEDTPEPESHRGSLGHSHVLEPDARNTADAFQIAKKLVSKAAVRLRDEQFWTTSLTLQIQFDDKTAWEGKAKFTEAQDTPTFLRALDDLWKNSPRRKPYWLGITYHPLIAADHHTPSLFENPKQERLSHAMDAINTKFGKNTAYFASLQESLHQAPTRIAFSRIPDLSEF